MVSRNIMGVMVLVSLLLLATGCQEPVVSDNTIVEDKGTEPANQEFDVIVTGTEGELIRLGPKAIDPDGDAVKYEFSNPFNENGRWQTSLGDEGDYLVTVKASDGMDYTAQDILVRVLRANRAPAVDCPSTKEVREGEVLDLGCVFVDPEGEELTIVYSGFMNSPRKEIGYDAAGRHTVLVTVSDADHEVDKNIEVLVKDVNRPPVVTFSDDVTVTEGDVVNVKPKVEDPDGDDVSIKYSNPFDSRGLWRTNLGDAGKYYASVVVSDGVNVESKEFRVVVLERNTAPEFDESVPDEIFVDEGEVITLDIDAHDREEDEIFISIEGFMNGVTKATTYDDAHPHGCKVKGCIAVYPVTVTVTDGKLETSKVISINVRDKNRPPVFRVPA